MKFFQVFLAVILSGIVHVLWALFLALAQRMQMFDTEQADRIFTTPARTIVETLPSYYGLEPAMLLMVVSILFYGLISLIVLLMIDWGK